MAKQATGIFDYVSPSGRTFFNKGRQYTSPTPQRSGKTIDPSLFAGKTAAGGAPLASREVAAPIQEAGPEAMSITDNIAATQPQMVTETQQPIENRGMDPRFMIQGGGPRIDLSGFFPERANKNYDPSKAIGGENVPYQASGFFRGLMGDPANRKNIEAQLAQGAEWKADAKEKAQEDRILNRMREADKPTQSRFEATQASGRESEANRVAAENKRLELEGKRVGLTERQIEEARLDRIDRLKGEQEDRAARIENMRTQNALADYTVGQNQLKANQPTITSLSGGGMAVMDPRSGVVSMINPGTGGFGTNPGTPPIAEQVYPPRTAPANKGGASVNRNDGSTIGGPLPTPVPAPENTALLPRFGRVLGGSASEAVNTVGDPLRAAGTEIYKTLLSSQATQDPEVLARMKLREENSRNATVPRFQNIPMGF
jgi:hypothetical protein